MWQALIWILSIAAMIFVIYDVFANQKKMSGGMKAVWTILAILFSIITAIVYFFVVYKK